MTQRKLPELFTDLIYDLLVDICGAIEDDRDNFIKAQTSDNPPFEYRFGGKLGFGGKFWNELPELKVTCYPEEENDNRIRTITKMNLYLRKLIQILKEAQKNIEKSDRQICLNTLIEIVRLIKQIPSGIDEYADRENLSPDDAMAHIGGLIFQEAENTIKYLTEGK